MLPRLGIVVLVAIALIGLIVYSQYQGDPDHVSGFIEADEVRVGSRIGGRVQAVHVEEGQRVEQGELLVELEPFDLLEREKQAAQALAAAAAEFQRLSNGLRPEEIAQLRARFEQFTAQYDALVAGPRPQEIEAARARLRLAESEQALAQQNYERVKRLKDGDAISQAEFDQASEKQEAARALTSVRRQELDLLIEGVREEERRAAKARVDEAEQAWLQAKNGYRQEEIEQARAKRAAAQAALNAIGEQRKELFVLSPVQGVVEALDLQNGDLVAANAPLLSLLDDRHLWVRAYVPQNRVGLQVGQTLRVTVDGYPDEQFSGQISFISRQAEFVPSNVQTPEERSKQVFRIKVRLPAGLAQLRPGMTADVWIDASEPTP